MFSGVILSEVEGGGLRQIKSCPSIAIACPQVIKDMFRPCILLLLAGAAFACNKACLDLCFPYHNEKLCFEQCGCNGPVAFAPEIVTEDGRRFKVATVPANATPNDDSYHYMGCNVNCGEVCFRFTVGYNLLNCVVGHCGCNALVSEVFPPPPPPPQPTYPVYQPPAQPQPAAPAAPQYPQYPQQPAQPQYPYVYQPAPAPVAAPQPAAPVAAPQPAPVAAPQPVAPAPVAAPQPATAPAAPQATPAASASSITMPFATQDGRHFEIRPLVSDSVFFQSGCAPCVDTCSRLTTYDLVLKCLGFCSCQTQVTEVRATPGY